MNSMTSTKRRGDTVVGVTIIVRVIQGYGEPERDHALREPYEPFGDEHGSKYGQKSTDFIEPHAGHGLHPEISALEVDYDDFFRVAYSILLKSNQSRLLINAGSMFKFTLFNLFIGLLITLARAAPAPTDVELDVQDLAPQTPSITSLEHEARAWINNCDHSTFINQSSSASPLVKDCQQIVKNISGGGTWHVALLAQRQLVQYGTCAFGVQAGFSLGVTNFRVGNSDIIDLINDSIKKFQWNGKVGAKGVMPCQTDPGAIKVKVDWTIYHNRK
ncbi:hypothetical protein CVT24_003234 [Panaeolus cyanescens]|uniref:Ecp2 effector protein-like domain-containing protein n=1 Tax=Panaeolus cyanescens TaxID=181874 RepID=A0A409YRC7_9AGAR|nr:hypothetical protein CVT24_003234 [Panaeolus cyanescens]